MTHVDYPYPCWALFMQEVPSVFNADDAMMSTAGANETMLIPPATKSIQGDASHVPWKGAFLGTRVFCQLLQTELGCKGQTVMLSPKTNLTSNNHLMHLSTLKDTKKNTLDSGEMMYRYLGATSQENSTTMEAH